MTIQEAVQRRISQRTYLDKPLEDQARKELDDYLATQTAGPFGRQVRLTRMDLTAMDAAELRKYGVYGVIRGAREFIAGAVQQGPGAMEDFGYCMQGAILKATQLGLGTVWLGGSFSRGTFSEKLGLRADEVLPCVTPVGYSAPKPSAIDSIMRFAIQARKRKPFGELFFDGAAGVPLGEQAAGVYLPALQAVRLGPSASNKQPWRVIRTGDAFHFCLLEDKVYNNALPGIHIQNLDIGIAMCDFELAAGELGLTGTWGFQQPDVHLDKLQHIATYKAQ